MNYFNIHTHIFNLKCAPNSFYGIPVANLLSNRNISYPIITILKKIFPGKGDVLSRYAKMLQIGSEKSQYEIFMDLLSNYSHLNMKFVVLSIDMDKMEGGKLINNYDTQISDLRRVKMIFPSQVLPFISIDPRKDYSPNLYKYLENIFKSHGFIGIKLYPALGFYPFDPALEELYSFAVNNNVPIMVHCTKGGIYYQGKLKQEHIYPNSFIDGDKHDFSQSTSFKMKDFKNNFTNPTHWEEVLKKFKSLKLCFAHFGGSSQILASRNTNATTENNFYLKIKQLLSNPNYPNVYTDISYTISDIKKIKPEIFSILNDEVLSTKLLFGTDYYLTIQEKREAFLVDYFLKIINAYDFEKIAKYNCINFLRSNFYNP